MTVYSFGEPCRNLAVPCGRPDMALIGLRGATVPSRGELNFCRAWMKDRIADSQTKFRAGEGKPAWFAAKCRLIFRFLRGIPTYASPYLSAHQLGCRAVCSLFARALLTWVYGDARMAGGAGTFAGLPGGGLPHFTS